MFTVDVKQQYNNNNNNNQFVAEWMNKYGKQYTVGI